jgi:regulatory protein
LKKQLTLNEAYLKAVSFCHYQERTQQDVRQRFWDSGLDEDEIGELIIRLSREGLIDEERFAKAYARGKHSIKKWGRGKIRQGLKAKQVSDYCIKLGMAEIDPDDYWNALLQVAGKKASLEKEKHPRIRRQKLLMYLISRGYEQDLSNMALDEVEGQK